MYATQYQQLPSPWHLSRTEPFPRRRPVATIRAFRRSDFDNLAERVASGEAWRTANDGFEQFLFEARRTAERLDRKYSVSRRLSSVVRYAGDRAREIDREFEIRSRWRAFYVDFGRNWPRYRKQLSDFSNTPLGKSSTTLFFLWFALSGWLFRVLVLAIWVLPIAGPLLIGTVANNLAIKGACPACKRQFIGYKNQIIRCAGCGNIVWQPKGKGDFSQGDGRSNSRSEPDIIDIEFEEK